MKNSFYSNTLNSKIYFFGIPILVYLLFSIVYFNELLPVYSSGIISGGTSISNDALGYPWSIYTFKQNFISGDPLFYTTNIIYPEGVSLYMHAYIPVVGFFSLFCSSPIMALNIYFLIQNIFSGFGAFLLGIHLKLNWFASLCLGALFAFSAYRLWRITGHYNLVLTGTVPFFILALFKSSAINEKMQLIINKKWLIVVFIIQLLTLFHDYYISYYQIIIAISYYLFYYLRLKSKDIKRLKIILSVIAFLIITHFIARLLDILNLDNKAGLWWGGDLINFINPTTNSMLYSQPFFKEIFSSWQHFAPVTESNIFLGFTFVVLFAWLCIIKIKDKTHADISILFFLIVVVLLFMFPTFKLAEKSMFNLPTAIVHYIPFVNNFRCNTRMGFFLPLLIPLALFLFISKKYPVNSNYIVCIITLCAIVESYPVNYSVFTIKNNVPSIYKSMEPLPNKVLTIMPTGLGDGFDLTGNFRNIEHFNQIIHRKKITGGLVSRLSLEARTNYLNDKVMNNLLLLSTNKDSTIQFPTHKEKELFFKYFKTDLFLIHPDFRNTFAESYVLKLVESKKTKKIIEDNYLLIVLTE